MKKYGLIGFPLGHSFSKGFFTDKFKNENNNECIYNNYPLENIELLLPLIKNDTEIKGLNVTIPFKEKVLHLVDKLDEKAAQIGAVNTLKIIRTGSKFTIEGYNTDCYGFEIPLLKVLKPYHRKALILGTGGASKAVKFVLEELGIEFLFVSRNNKGKGIITYRELTNEIINNHHLIINTSPLGMFPDINSCPEIPCHAITDRHILYDLVYNPEKTLFLTKGGQKKATLLNGLPMLHLQAEKSWEIWNL